MMVIPSFFVTIEPEWQLQWHEVFPVLSGMSFSLNHLTIFIVIACLLSIWLRK